MSRKPDDPIVLLTCGELESLLRRAAAEGARSVASELRDDWLTTSQVCEQYDLKRSTVNTAVSRGDLKAEDRATSGGKGKTHRFRRSEVERWRRSKGAA